MSENKNSWLDDIDNKASNKGNKIKSLWQFIKFLVVSLLATAIQLILVNLLYIYMKGITTPLPLFLSKIFTETTVGVGHDNWGYILPFFLSNLIANIVGYFLNKSKTFKSDAPMWHFVIYIIILLALIMFSTWLQGVIVNAMELTEISALVRLAPTVAAMAAGTVQMIVLFVLQKFVLLKEKKTE